jgi:ATP-dependent RNA helicase DeaD
MTKKEKETSETVKDESVITEDAQDSKTSEKEVKKTTKKKETPTGKSEEQELTFADLGLSADILSALEQKGFKTPSPIQTGVIPLLLNGDKDIIGQAQTGTGKTAAFALPLLELLDSKKKEIQAIIMAPTRELAIQVAEEIRSFAVENPATVQTIYGGNPIGLEVKGIKNKPTIVVGTPGRIQHHIRTNVLKLGTVKYFVLDEADEMLNFGFRKEIESILALTAPERRILLFSATMPQAILDIAKTHMGEYDSVKVASKEMTNENITQKYFLMRKHDKVEALARIMAAESHFYAIVFCRTKRETDKVAAELRARNLLVEAIHGDIDQKARQNTLARFKDGTTKILVATDVAARGIDVAELNFVINFTIPENHEIYTHRIGRTGRAGNIGTAITFVDSSEKNKLRYFERALNVTMEKGELPDAAKIIVNKTAHLVEKLEHIINNEDMSDVRAIASTLLEEGNPEDVVAALLKSAYSSEFNLDTYRKISEDTSRASGGRSTGGRSYSNKSGFNSRGREGSGSRARGGYARSSGSRSGGSGYSRSSGSRGGSNTSSRSTSTKKFTKSAPKAGTGNPKGLKSAKRGKDAYESKKSK